MGGSSACSWRPLRLCGELTHVNSTAETQRAQRTRREELELDPSSSKDQTLRLVTQRLPSQTD
jgi:hypothetical protein